MLSRRTILGSMAVVGVGLITSVVAFAHGGGPGEAGRDEARRVGDGGRRAGAGQGDGGAARADPRRARPRVRGGGGASADARRGTGRVLALFEADTLDPARVAAVRRSVEAEHRQIGDAISQAPADVHEVLTPAQRKRSPTTSARTGRPKGRRGNERAGRRQSDRAPRRGRRAPRRAGGRVPRQERDRRHRRPRRGARLAALAEAASTWCCST